MSNINNLISNSSPNITKITFDELELKYSYILYTVV